MKYVVFLLDGMADYPLDSLGGKTPLETADTPRLDRAARSAAFGTFLTLPEGFPTSSDVANMSVLGWDLAKCYTGRGAIETYGAGYDMDADTVAFRLNLITVTDGRIEDYSAGHLPEEDGEELVAFLQEKLGDDRIAFLKGVSYRNLLHLRGKEFSPAVLYEKPDSSHGEVWKDCLPKAAVPEAEGTATLLRSLVLESEKLLGDHPVNRRRVEKGENPANLAWPWSGGRKPEMPSFEENYGKRGSIISAVDVILGLGKLGKMEYLRPEGATGWIDTDYEGKSRAALDLLERNDFVYLHVEGVDECGHLGDLEKKIRAIEDCDRRLIGTFLDGYNVKFGKEPLRCLVLPDHPVPVSLRKHTRDRVPFMLWGAGVEADLSIREYSERTCPKGKYAGLEGRQLMDLLFQ